MKRIVIIGNSAAGFSCGDNLLKFSQENEITVISQEGPFAYNRSLLLEFLSGKISQDFLSLGSTDYYEKNRINFLTNSKVVSLNTRRQAIILKDNSKVNYDYLVIATGQRPFFPDLPGDNKDGVIKVYTLEDIKKIKDHLVVSDTICLVGEAHLCFLLCNIFAEKGKQVKVISKPRPEAAIPQDNVEWLDSQELTEIIGEGLELKAVKLSTGKAIGCSQVLFLGNYKPNTEFLKDTPVRLIEDYVWVDDKLQTSLENIFACGAVCRQDGFSGVGKSWDEAHREGVLAAENLINLLERGRIPCQPMS